jgi:LuxR family transcriptional regulator, quorum-sensing system regulator SolR
MGRSSSEADYDDALSHIGQANTKESLLAALSRTAAEMGFDHAALDYVPSRVTGLKPQHVSTYSTKWLDDWMQLPIAVVAHDPVLHHLENSVSPIVWDQSDYMSAKLDNVYELFQGYGLGSGLAINVRGPHGDCAYVGFSSSEQRISKPNERTSELGQLMLSASAAYTAMSKLIKAPSSREQAVQLTRRELEVLKWSRAGKTALDCSQIIGISQATVHFHLKNTLQKLDVASKQQAVLKALEMRLIH